MQSLDKKDFAILGERAKELRERERERVVTFVGKEGEGNLINQCKLLKHNLHFNLQ
jgi:hypothetical protein